MLKEALKAGSLSALEAQTDPEGLQVTILTLPSPQQRVQRLALCKNLHLTVMVHCRACGSMWTTLHSRRGGGR